MINSILKSVFDGYGEYRRKNPQQWRYDELPKENQIYDPDYLRHLYDNTDDTMNHSRIYEHLKHHEVNDPIYPRYFKLYEDINNNFHRGN